MNTNSSPGDLFNFDKSKAVWGSLDDDSEQVEDGAGRTPSESDYVVRNLPDQYKDS
jgi:hypothetical protein